MPAEKAISGAVLDWRNRTQIEAFVLVKDEELPLRRRPMPGSRVRVFSDADRDKADLIEYIEGTDYTVDYTKAAIRRTANSRIADWSLHPMYGVVHFDHTAYGDSSNRAYTVYAEYDYASEAETADSYAQQEGSQLSTLLPIVAAKLQSGEEVVYVVYGDSISTGGEASQECFAYYRRFADYMCELYPGSSIRIINKAIGGETSEGGAARVESDVLPFQPDLVSIGYGMNDQNLYEHGVGVLPEDFGYNLRHMIETIRSNGDTDIVLVTPCMPNPLWRHTSVAIDRYSDVIHQLSKQYHLTVADVQLVWKQELAAGKTPESLLLNNINHPNDYGHFIYFTAFAKMFNE
ncbi:SGNH/GDSL hydrolase family protein [Paenibacillus paridis]|uniref:SGNH/GDSL hydrolase family protein n=1 Tax=Paenibacillus paridis TaxID=2583376 RepID=UPI0011248B65|nr:GDSL-type esterase/lipase family protein [Paenibacillus paridis]